MMLKTIVPTLTHNGVRYAYQQVLKLGKTGPKTFITADEINIVGTLEENPEHIVTITGIDPEVAIAETIVFKQHGKFTVLVADKYLQDAIANTKPFTGRFKVNIISTPSLKKAKLDQDKPIVAPAAYANHPRMV
jgi:hypothetical protein